MKCADEVGKNAKQGNDTIISYCLFFSFFPPADIGGVFLPGCILRCFFPFLSCSISSTEFEMKDGELLIRERARARRNPISSHHGHDV